MRILIVGACAIGGYFGGRLLQAGSDVTFLVRPTRAAQLRKIGLVIVSPTGNVTLKHPPTVQADALRRPFDLILLSCKAYDLSAAMDSLAPAVGATSLVLPVLNGMRHLDVLDERFGKSRVLGGQCAISAVLDEDGRIRHLNDLHILSFGERDSPVSERAERVRRVIAPASFDARLSAGILQEMWEKWVFIATLAGITSLMRATVGDLVAAGTADRAATLYRECAQIAAENGFAPGEDARQRGLSMLTAPGSGLTASMLRDIENGRPTEGEQILGDLLRRKRAHTEAGSLLAIAHAHVRAYEARRSRELAQL